MKEIISNVKACALPATSKGNDFFSSLYDIVWKRSFLMKVVSVLSKTKGNLTFFYGWTGNQVNKVRDVTQLIASAKFSHCRKVTMYDYK